MHACKYHDAVRFQQVVNAVRKTSQQDASDLAPRRCNIENRKSLGISYNSGFRDAKGARELRAQSLGLVFVPNNGFVDFRFS